MPGWPVVLFHFFFWLKVGLGISRTNADSQWNPVYNVFIEIFVVETKRFIGSFVHVILTRQTCGQRSSRAAESKRRALGNYFVERICYTFLLSKCKGDWDPGLCTTSGLAFEEPQRNGKIRFFLRRNTFFSRKSIKACACACSCACACDGDVKPKSEVDWEEAYQIKIGWALLGDLRRPVYEHSRLSLEKDHRDKQLRFRT